MLPALYMLVALLLMSSNESSAHRGRFNCLMYKNVTGSIGVIIDRSTRVGKEQEIAMKIAVQDTYRDSCIQLTLHVRDSSQISNPVTSIASKLLHNRKVQAIIGTLSLPEDAVLSEDLKNFLGIPVIFLSPIAIPPTLAPSVTAPASNLIQMANSISSHVQCLASMVKYFQWQRVTVIFEKSNTFSQNSEVISVLSDSLKSVDSTVKQHLAFPPIGSLSDPDIAIEQELRKLRDMENQVFVVLHSSLELAACIFQKAHLLGMVEKGFVWIISDEIASLLNSVDSSVTASMQGVIGYQTSFVDTSESYKRFKAKFERSYLAKYPDDQGSSNPSLFALRAYDAVQVIGKAKLYSKALLPSLLLSKSVGLSGNMSFKNGMLENPPIFRIINVVGNGYQELAFWSSAYGFSKKPPTQSGLKDDNKNQNNGVPANLGPIFWPGGQETVPKGLSSGVSNENKRLRIGVPALGVFPQFVDVNIDEVHNRTLITGFAVDVFKASLKYLPYDLPFALVPFYGTYDELVHEIYRKGFDAAVGDINILEERYKWADFSQPYVKSGMVMVVTVKEDKANNMWMFLMVFDSKMWVVISSMGLFMGRVTEEQFVQDSPCTMAFSSTVVDYIFHSFTYFVDDCFPVTTICERCQYTEERKCCCWVQLEFIPLPLLGRCFAFQV
ncbi:Glutamate receptor 2.7 [Bienertia sinuspersici]